MSNPIRFTDTILLTIVNNSGILPAEIAKFTYHSGATIDIVKV